MISLHVVICVINFSRISNYFSVRVCIECACVRIVAAWEQYPALIIDPAILVGGS